MITRRSLFVGAGAMTLSQLLAGCGGSPQTRLNVRLLQGSVPAQLLQQFEKQLKQGEAVTFTPVQQLTALYDLLQRGSTPPQSSGWGWLPGQRSEPTTFPDVITLGDYWLGTAVQQNLILPLTVETIQGWKTIPEEGRSLVTRNSMGQPDSTGVTWGAPYRWGTMAIAYHKDAFDELGWTPNDWGDLWRPELARRISLPDNARAVIGLVLKTLGESFNTRDLDAVPNLAAELASLHQQVRVYSSDTYLQPLLTNDTWLAVGWSSDILGVTRRNPRVQAVVPASGTLRWADLWVRPNLTPSQTIQTTPDLVRQWIEFIWQKDTAIRQSVLGTAASPVLTHVQGELPSELQGNPLLLPDPAILNRSEFLQPLPEAIAQTYRRYWTTMRQTG